MASENRRFLIRGGKIGRAFLEDEVLGRRAALGEFSAERRHPFALVF